MKIKLFFLFVTFLTFFFTSLILNAQEKQIKFYLNDGSFKTYNINDIDSMNLIKSNSNYVMKIFYDENQIAYYPTEVISKIQFDTDTANNRLMNVFVYGYPKSIKLSLVDSIYFYQDIYQPLSIGSQVWMLKNLNVDHYRNGDSIPNVRDSDDWSKLYTGGMCYYQNNDEIDENIGKLYNWFAISDYRVLAPIGWHVPTDEEWKILEQSLGMTKSQVNSTEWRGTNEGGKLKATGQAWGYNFRTTNESGFSAFPNGIRYYLGEFHNLQGYCDWWSSKEVDTINAWKRRLGYNVGFIHREKINKRYGFYIRCVMDNGDTAPVISSITPTSASIGNDIVLTGSGFISRQGLSFVSFNNTKATQYINWCDTLIKVKVIVGASSGKVSVTINGVKSNEVDFTLESSDSPSTIEMVLIPAGTFQMGQDGVDNAYIVHTVKITKAFYMSKYEITQKQYTEITGSNQSYFFSKLNNPIEQVTWYDAVQFCNELSKKEGLEQCYTLDIWHCDFKKNGYRLPTEAEWEYACRAGTGTNYYSGNTESQLDSAGWYLKNSYNTTHPVGQKAANKFGLFDMHGNVLEWCSNCFYGYNEGTFNDPTGPSTCMTRSFRGGSFSENNYLCLSAKRNANYPDYRYNNIGFRVVRTK
ncbi:MAG: serine/threonine kinase [Ignavibacteria bacterium]|nr:serine/threonine kinase [Ignavibacteria bacterium]